MQYVRAANIVDVILYGKVFPFDQKRVEDCLRGQQPSAVISRRREGREDNDQQERLHLKQVAAHHCTTPLAEEDWFRVLKS